jgi:hypothetical protein
LVSGAIRRDSKRFATMNQNPCRRRKKREQFGTMS